MNKHISFDWRNMMTPEQLIDATFWQTTPGEIRYHDQKNQRSVAFSIMQIMKEIK